MSFNPLFTLTPRIVQNLLRVEAARQKVAILPLTPYVLASLRETARLFTTHYSTMIEGNRLQPSEIEQVLKNNQNFPGKERDEKEVKGYYAALTKIEQVIRFNQPLAEELIKTFHALVMAGGKTKVTATSYRDGQNVIRDGRTHEIVYLPPEAQDVPLLMHEMVEWLNNATHLPPPIVASVAHYQFATIHPYYDGNGRTARILTTFLLHKGGYGLKGLYSLEEYYAQNLPAYYAAISIGHYQGRAEADITAWIDYFMEGMATSFENVIKRMQEAGARNEEDQSNVLRTLDPQQRKVLELFTTSQIVTAKEIGTLLGLKPRSCALLCKKWVDDEFLEIVDAAEKSRKYQLTQTYEALVLKKMKARTYDIFN